MYYKISIAIIMQLIKTFASSEINAVGEKVGFNKRDSGLKVFTFFKAFTIGTWDAHEVTLEIIAGKCEEFQYGLKLTKQALWDRLGLGAKLMKQLLGIATGFAVKNSYKAETMEILKQFKDVLICDATTISLPNKLMGIFKGLGGTNAKSALKIQAVFSLINKNFKNFELFSATSSDGKYTYELVKKLQPSELIIFDLGYFCTKAFKDITDKGAYFVSRVKTNTLFYIESLENKSGFDKVNILDIFNKSNGLVDQWINIGKDKLLVRLVAIRLPEEKINERRRKENKKAAAKGKTLTAYETELLAWNIIITDVPENMLSSKTMCEIYRIRWQIELIFKTWKGCFAIDQMNNIGENYFNCLMYGKLIMITLMTTVYSIFNFIVFKQRGRLLSFARFFKNLREKLETIIANLIYRYSNARKIYSSIESCIKRSLEEKRKRKTTERLLMEQDLPNLGLQMLD